MMTRRTVWVGLLALFACTDQDPQPDRAPAPAAAPVPARAREAVPGAPYFDPRTIRAGDTIAGLRVIDVRLQPTLDAGFAGSVSFSGAIQLQGDYRPHFDFPEVDVPCFWVDSASWHRLPRMQGDSRSQVWFCFRNPELAIRKLGALEKGKSVPVTIAVDSFTAHISQSDAWDEAVLK
jgi:hypothetical protein